jgi:hypothetical protein
MQCFAPEPKKKTETEMGIGQPKPKRNPETPKFWIFFGLPPGTPPTRQVLVNGKYNANDSLLC